MKTILFVIVFISISIGISFFRLSIIHKQELKQFVTTQDSKYCYSRYAVNKNMKRRNFIYYSSLELCGKPYK